MTGHVDVGVVTVVRLVLHVRHIDGDAALALFGRVVDVLELCERRTLNIVGEHLGDRSGERGLAVVDVAHRPHVDVGLGPLERLLGHDVFPCLCLRELGLGDDHSPRTRATISSWTFAGVGWYESNCIVYVARPCVRERRSVLYPNISESGTSAFTTWFLPRCSVPCT